MTQDSVKDRKLRNAARSEFALVRDPKRTGPAQRRKMPERQLASLSDTHVTDDSHSDIASWETGYALPREDRAG